MPRCDICQKERTASDVPYNEFSAIHENMHGWLVTPSEDEICGECVKQN